MIQNLTENIIAISEDELNPEIKSVNFIFNKGYSKNSPALRIDFKNNLRYSVYCIRKLIKFKEKNINFNTSYQGKNIKYIISNYSTEILDCLKAIEISDRRERYTFLYETLCDEIDTIWKKFNPCNFCDGICAAAKDEGRYNEPNGCCSKAFDLHFFKNPFAILTPDKYFPCPYLGEKNGCTTQNIPCKLYICPYIKKNHLIDLHPSEFIIYEAFFDKKQKLVLTYNLFRSKEQLIDKLLEKDHNSYYFYSSRMKYLILDK